MEHRVAQKKLMFYHHLINLPEGSLAHEIAATQMAMSYPGLVMECKTLIEFYQLPDAKTLSKFQWKKSVKKKIYEQNRANLLETVLSRYKKLDYNILREENLEMKDYMKSLNLPDARLKFALRSKMTKTVQMNYKGEPKFIRNGWKCQGCNIPDTQDHILRCPCYQELRVGKNLQNDKDLVEYFRKVIQLRDKCDDS